MSYNLLLLKLMKVDSGLKECWDGIVFTMSDMSL
jgi:hypothetical protein